MEMVGAEDAFVRWCFGIDNISVDKFPKESVETFKDAVRGLYWDRLLKRRKYAQKNLATAKANYDAAWQRKSASASMEA